MNPTEKKKKYPSVCKGAYNVDMFTLASHDSLFNHLPAFRIYKRYVFTDENAECLANDH